jgi:hypothetical protein
MASASNGLAEEYELPARTSAACLRKVLMRGDGAGVFEITFVGGDSDEVVDPPASSSSSLGSTLSGEARVDIPMARCVAHGLAARIDRDEDPRSPNSKSSGSNGFDEENEDSENSSAPFRLSVLRRGEGVGVDDAMVRVPGRGMIEGLPTSIMTL